MNTALFRSRHAVGAAVLVALLAAWHWLAGSPFGSRDDANVWYLLATGWIAVLLFVFLAAYAVRRAAHRLRLSPEFQWKARLGDLERAGSQLTELQNRVSRREVVGSTEVRRASDAILRRHGVQRVLCVDLEPDPAALGAVRIRVQPREPLGRLATWLQAHVWYGVAAAFVVVFHGGLRWSSTMGMLLNAMSAFVILSGFVGIVLWAVAPTWLTRAERELSIEKVHALREHFRRKVAEALGGVREATGTQSEVRTRRDLAVLRGQWQQVEREWRRLARYRAVLRGWRLLHVPGSLLLLALVAVHVLGVLLY